MLKIGLSCVLALATVGGSDAAQCGRTVMSNDFNRYSGGYKLWSIPEAAADFPPTDKRPGFNGDLVDDGLIFKATTAFSRLTGNPHNILKGGKDDGNRAYVGQGNLRVTQPKGGVGTTETGLLFQVRLPEALRTATLSYKFKFSDDYDWTSGGKLPGLCDEDCPTGCLAKPKDGGWSGRVHWRTFGRLTSYMYLPESQKGCGLDVRMDNKLVAGSWHTMTIYYGMNTPGKKNGVQKIWVDGDLWLSQNNVVFDNTGKHDISILKFDNFHGGKSDKFRPKKTQFVWFDDLAVQEGECAPSGAGIPKAPTTVPKQTTTTVPKQTMDDGNCATAGSKGRCHGPDASHRKPCCTSDLKCIQKDKYYGQCRPLNAVTPDGWVGTILNYGTPVTPTPKVPTAPKVTTPTPKVPKTVPVTPPNTASDICAPVNGRCYGNKQEQRRACCSSSLKCMQKNAFYAKCVPEAAKAPKGWIGTIIDYGSPTVTPTASPKVTPTVPKTPTPAATPPKTPVVPPTVSSGKCAASFKRCGDGEGKCCSSGDQCVRKNAKYSACRPKSRAIPSGWEGTVIA